jgi:hypothetical protein
MTDCTELRFPSAGNGRAGEGQEGMPIGPSMTDCTELRLPAAGDGRDGEGQEGMPRETA